MADIFGSNGNDRGDNRLDGTPENDLIDGLAGDDELFGLGGSDTLIGGAGSDTLVPGPTDGNGYQDVRPGTGSDLVDLTGSDDFIELRYFDHPTGMTVLLNEATDTAQSTDGNGDTDTYVDFGRQAREHGIYFGGTDFDDSYDVLSSDRSSYIHVDLGYGNDTITVREGEGTVRIGAVEDGTQGVLFDIPNGQIDAGAGGLNDLIIEGAPRRIQFQGREAADTFIGGDNRQEQWIWRGGNDTVDGGGALDTLRMDQSRSTNVVVDLEQGIATGQWDGVAYTLTLSNIEEVVGSRNDGSTLRGDAGANFLEGRDSDDTLIGRDGNDELRGGDGNDFLDGGAGENRLRGEGGNDTLISGNSNDNVSGGDGNDRIDLTAMTEGFGGFISPGLGQDTILGSRQLWDNGEAHDLAYEDVSGVGGVTIEVGDEGTGTAISGDGRVNDSFEFFHFFVGSEDADQMTSFDEEDETFRFEGYRGGAGDDTIDGGANGFDAIDYRSERFSNDNVQAVTVNLSTGVAIDTYGDRDTLTDIESVRGTALDDRFIGSNTQEFAWFRGYAGVDTIQGSELIEQEDGTLFGFETANYSDDARDGGEAGVLVDLAAGTGRDGFGDVDVLILVDGVQGTDVDDVIRGNETVNSFRGRAGNDLMEGRGGDDIIRGFEGDDTLDGGTGDDRMEGGTGSDLYIVDSSDDEAIEFASDEGFDEVRTSQNFAIGEGIERLAATGTRDVRLDGTAGAEELAGNAGSNILVGFGGEDTMSGGGDGDTFVLTALRGTDPNVTITDWGRGNDRLAIDDQLLGIGERGINIRDLTADVFRDIRDSGAVGYNSRTGELLLDIDGDGNRELVATLEGGAQLGLDDVLLF